MAFAYMDLIFLAKDIFLFSNKKFVSKTNKALKSNKEKTL